jgi:hypothetical protein
MNRSHRFLSLPLVALAAACGPAETPKAPPVSSIPVAPAASTSTPPAVRRAHAAVPRMRFNRLAVELDLPLFWLGDKNGDGAVDADEIVELMFYDGGGAGASRWVDGGKLSAELEAAYAKIEKAATAAPPAGEDAEAQRRRLVLEDLAQGAPTLVYNDLRGVSDAEKSMVKHVVAAAKLVDAIYAKQTGIIALLPQVPGDDPASQSLFRRNWGPKCVGPRTEKNPLCSAIPGAPAPIVDSYPVSLQKDPKFCDALEKRADAKALLGPFTVVREEKGKLVALSLPKAYAKMADIATELRAAASALEGTPETALRAYLDAAAKSFDDGEWERADEAWSKMNAQNSKWFLRIGADEVYWEPCNHKAGFHVTFARINDGSLKWQEKLAPVEQEMENALGAQIGAPYKARKVTFHLPDFIDIVFNAGDDRNAIGATVGQSLPNWGKVVKEGRGRTVAMSNLYTDPDSMRVRRMGAESLLTKEGMAAYSDDPGAGMLKTILHEATHNLGPAHEYSFKAKTDAQWFGGGLATMLEELKAETGALYFVDWLLKKGTLDADLAKKAYTDGIVWAFGHISRGMYSDGGQRKPYSQLAAIQIGFLLDEGALTFDPNATAANGTDKGAFTIHLEKMPAASDKMMKVVGAIKASGDKAGAEALSKKYVDGDAVPQKLITERLLRHPKASFVYAMDL